MRLLLIIAIVIAVFVVVGMLILRRPAPEHQTEPIDAVHDPDPPPPEQTRHMPEPPPGSRGDRERRGKP